MGATVALLREYFLGDTVLLAFTVMQPGTTKPYNLAGCTLYSTLCLVNGAVLWTGSTSTSGITIDDAVNGLGTLAIDGTWGIGMTSKQVATYDVRMKDPQGNRFTTNYGTIPYNVPNTAQMP